MDGDDRVTVTSGTWTAMDYVEDSCYSQSEDDTVAVPDNLGCSAMGHAEDSCDSQSEENTGAVKDKDRQARVSYFTKRKLDSPNAPRHSFFSCQKVPVPSVPMLELDSCDESSDRGGAPVQPSPPKNSPPTSMRPITGGVQPMIDTYARH